METKCSNKYCNNIQESNSIYCQDCNVSPKSLIDDKEAEQTANKILNKTFEKAITQLQDDFFTNTQSYLYEIMENNKENIMEEALNLIIGKQWAKYRDKYNMKELRARIYKENKEDINKDITEQVVQNEIKRYFNLFLSDGEKTDWRYKDLENKIIDWIYNNYNQIKIKDKIPEKFIKENERLKKEVERLNLILEEIKNIT